MSKGSQFERDFCRSLSKWWTGNEDDNVFWRTANSGGRATARAKAGKGTKVHCGDVGAINPIGQPLLDLVTFELKKGYNRATFHDLLDRPDRATPQVWEKWVEKVQKSSKQAGTPYWLIIHKRDYREPIVLIPTKFYWKFCEKDEPASIIEPIKGELSWAMRLEDFLRAVNPDNIKKGAQE